MQKDEESMNNKFKWEKYQRSINSYDSLIDDNNNYIINYVIWRKYKINKKIVWFKTNIEIKSAEE